MQCAQRSNDAIHSVWLHRVSAAAGALMLAALGGCGGGSGSTMMNPGTATAQTCSPSTCGSAVMSLTDAAGDFLSYKVALMSLSLKKTDGSTVETLPATTTVDLAQLVNLSEIISAKQIPAGEYSAAMVTVDFSAAAIVVDDGSGTGVAVTPIGASGAALGQMKLTVQLDAKNDLKIGAGKASRIAFDFNLLASNVVDLAAKTVTVNPVLVASIAPADNKTMRVRGSLISVDPANSDYVVQVLPFHDHSDAKLDPLTVHTSDTTTFEINGIPYTGAAGLTQLATLPASTPAVAFGTLQAADLSFAANRVLAGTSVEGAGIDHIVGNVVARSGNTLTVHGARMDRHGDDDEFVAGDATVTIAGATAVTAEGQASITPSHTIGEISVGSRIEAFGTASTDSAQRITLDATSGRIRLDFTRLQGVVSVLDAASITLTLSAIDRQPVSLFMFAGTGATPAQDSVPANYIVSTGVLDLTPFAAGQPILGLGFVAAFGAAPPDFTAVTLATGEAAVGQGGDDGNEMESEGEAELTIDWGIAGTTAPFTTLDPGHLDLDVANSSIGTRHRIETEHSAIDLKALASDPSIIAAVTDKTLFAISHQLSHSIDNFNGFADFEAKLNADLNGTVTAVGLTAEGQYDAAANVFAATHMVVMLND